MGVWLLFFSFLAGLLSSWGIAQFKDKIGLIDIPSSRSSHSVVIPKGAGMGTLAAFLTASLSLPLPLWLWIPATCISLVSLFGGDRHLLSVNARLFVQFGCSFFFLLFLLNPTQGSIHLFLLAVPLSVFIVGTSNLYNFMDGIDGIAGITSVVGFCLLWFYIGWIEADPVYGDLCLVLIFSCLGFLCFNLPQAKVFLGDVGSVFLGFLFSCLVVGAAERVTDFMVMTGFIAPFYFDELVTMKVRIQQGDSLIVPHRKHVYQLLANELGISHWKISTGYGFFQMIIGLSGIYLASRGAWSVLLAYLGYGLIFFIFSGIVRKKAADR